MKFELNQELNFAYINQKAKEIQNLTEIFDFEISNGFVKPAGVSYLSSLLHTKQSLFGKLNYIDSDNFRYLQRTNFFQNLEVELDENFSRHSTLGNMLECTKVAKDSDPDFIEERLKKILKVHLGSKEHLILGILLTTYEIVDNILEHSKGGEFQIANRVLEQPGFVCAQYYGGNKNSIQIGISDAGIGIVESMKDAYADLAREDILKKPSNSTRHGILKSCPHEEMD